MFVQVAEDQVNRRLRGLGDIGHRSPRRVDDLYHAEASVRRGPGLVEREADLAGSLGRDDVIHRAIERLLRPRDVEVFQRGDRRQRRIGDDEFRT